MIHLFILGSAQRLIESSCASRVLHPRTASLDALWLLGTHTGCVVRGTGIYIYYVCGTWYCHLYIPGTWEETVDAWPVIDRALA